MLFEVLIFSLWIALFFAPPSFLQKLLLRSFALIRFVLFLSTWAYLPSFLLVVLLSSVAIFISTAFLLKKRELLKALNTLMNLFLFAFYFLYLSFPLGFIFLSLSSMVFFLLRAKKTKLINGLFFLLLTSGFLFSLFASLIFYFITKNLSTRFYYSLSPALLWLVLVFLLYRAKILHPASLSSRSFSQNSSLFLTLALLFFLLLLFQKTDFIARRNVLVQ